ncbi:hypothetical protein A3Q56_04791 [Intoshia linei]|uniref:Uncharacterized protein n=1 Tax=Intoshia linei TaxID=1819745 RepID=A0A177B1F7_9BILA|nr:hypothetical protein A3Q56_04791 [Intoshia linei]
MISPINKKMKVQDQTIRNEPSISYYEMFCNRFNKNTQNNSMHESSFNFNSTNYSNASFGNLENTNLNKSEKIETIYGLPVPIWNTFLDIKKVVKLYDWQNKCLSLSCLESRENLIYCVPTSGGKTLIAEILIVQTVLMHQLDAILVLPYVSIVEEKMKALSELGMRLQFIVEDYSGTRGRIPPIKRRNKRTLYIATIEKANAIINSLIEDERISDIGICAIDELHMLGNNADRSCTLEMMINKLLVHAPVTQIIGMSATISNLGDFATFMNARIFSDDFRPVNLDEFIKYDYDIYEINKKFNPCDEIITSHSRNMNDITIDEINGNGGRAYYTFKKLHGSSIADVDNIYPLVQEIIPSKSVIIFCPTKRNAENVALMLSSNCNPNFLNIRVNEKMQLLATLKEDGMGSMCPILSKTIPCGIAYHHAGLTRDERKSIEDAYNSSIIYVICCTSTLAAGVNLPARRVIIRSPYVGRNFLTFSEYKQMSGRAGRAGIDEIGDSIVILNNLTDKEKFINLIRDGKRYCESCLSLNDYNGLKRLILSSTIGPQIYTNKTIYSVIEKTLFYTQQCKNNFASIDETVNTCIEMLIKNRLIDIEKSQLIPSPLGVASNNSYMPLEKSQLILSHLRNASKTLCLQNHLHLLYLVVPIDIEAYFYNYQMNYTSIFNNLSEYDQHVCLNIGISENMIFRKSSGNRLPKDNEDKIKRFFCAILLHQVWLTKSCWKVASMYNVDRGIVQNLLSNSASQASSLCRFVEKFEDLWCLEKLLPQVAKDLALCAEAELLDLLEIPGLKVTSARELYDNGLKCIKDVALCEEKTLVKSSRYLLSYEKAKKIIYTSRMLLSQKVKTLEDQVEEILKI